MLLLPGRAVPDEAVLSDPDPDALQPGYAGSDPNASRRGFARLLLMILATAWFVGSLPSEAPAQVSMVEDLSPRFEWRGRLRADYRNDFDTETDGGDRFDSWRVSLGGDFGGPINESILVGFRARYERAQYDFRLDNGAFPSATYGTNEFPKEPWGGLDTIDLMPTLTVLVGDRFSVTTAVPIRWSGEVGSRRNGFNAGISALVGWQVVDGFRVGLGIGVTSQIESDTETFPVVALDWRINESLRLATDGNWIQGGSTGLFWIPNPAISLSLSVGYERNRFRLDDNGTLPDTNGVAEITVVPIEIGFRFRIVEGAYFDLKTGLGVAGRFRVEDDQGRKLYDQNYDAVPRVRVGLTIPIGSKPRMSVGSRTRREESSDGPASSW